MWRQEVGGSSIETSKIAGHSNVGMTEEYTIVQMKRQEDLTRRIQDKLAKAKKRVAGRNVIEIKKKRRQRKLPFGSAAPPDPGGGVRSWSPAGVQMRTVEPVASKWSPDTRLDAGLFWLTGKPAGRLSDTPQRDYNREPQHRRC